MSMNGLSISHDPLEVLHPAPTHITSTDIAVIINIRFMVLLTKPQLRDVGNDIRGSSLLGVCESPVCFPTLKILKRMTGEQSGTPHVALLALRC